MAFISHAADLLLPHGADLNDLLDRIMDKGIVVDSAGRIQLMTTGARKQHLRALAVSVEICQAVSATLLKVVPITTKAKKITPAA